MADGLQRAARSVVSEYIRGLIIIIMYLPHRLVVIAVRFGQVRVLLVQSAKVVPHLHIRRMHFQSRVVQSVLGLPANDTNQMGAVNYDQVTERQLLPFGRLFVVRFVLPPGHVHRNVERLKRFQYYKYSSETRADQRAVLCATTSACRRLPSLSRVERGKGCERLKRFGGEKT